MSTKNKTKTVVNFDEKKYSLNEITRLYYDKLIEEDEYHEDDVLAMTEEFIQSITKNEKIKVDVNRVVKITLDV